MVKNANTFSLHPHNLLLMNDNEIKKRANLQAFFNSEDDAL